MKIKSVPLLLLGLVSISPLFGHSKGGIFRAELLPITSEDLTTPKIRADADPRFQIKLKIKEVFIGEGLRKEEELIFQIHSLAFLLPKYVESGKLDDLYGDEYIFALLKSGNDRHLLTRGERFLEHHKKQMKASNKAREATQPVTPSAEQP